METIIDRLRKIYALAEKGHQGEKVVAQQKLDSLLEKHNLTLDDIRSSEKNFCEYKYKTSLEKDILFQCAVYIRGSDQIRHGRYKNKKSIHMELTKIEQIDLQLMYDHYRNELKKDLKVFFQAFIQRHKIFPPQKEDNNKTPDKDIDLEKLFKMVDGMSSKSWNHRRVLTG